MGNYSYIILEFLHALLMHGDVVLAFHIGRGNIEFAFHFGRLVSTTLKYS